MAETAIATPTPRPQARLPPSDQRSAFRGGVPTRNLRRRHWEWMLGTWRRERQRNERFEAERRVEKRRPRARPGVRHHFLPQGHYDWTKPPPKHLKD